MGDGSIDLAEFGEIVSRLAVEETGGAPGSAEHTAQYNQLWKAYEEVSSP